MCCENNGSWLFIILVAIVVIALFGNGTTYGYGCGNTCGGRSSGGCLGTSGCGCGCN